MMTPSGVTRYTRVVVVVLRSVELTGQINDAALGRLLGERGQRQQRDERSEQKFAISTRFIAHGRKPKA